MEPRPPCADIAFAELEKLKPARDPRAGWGQIKAEAGSLSTASFLQRAAQRTREAALESPPADMVRHCGRLREVIFFLSMVPKDTGDVRGVFGGPRGHPQVGR